LVDNNNKKYFLDDRIFSTDFFCDLKVCKGGCCTIRSKYGAPIKKEEIEIIREILDKVLIYVPERNKKVIKERDFYFREEEKIYLNNVNDEDCVFSYITESVAKCSFEIAYRNGEIGFKKPISCELFPIRTYETDSIELRFEKMSECDDAIRKGKEEKTKVFEFVKDAIERAYGKEFYNNLLKYNKGK
jgi:hypothetical protein